jgi:hypothetical protein
MLTLHRVRAAYRQIGLRPASDTYLDRTRGVSCPTMAVCLAEGRLQRRQVTTKNAYRRVLAALDEPAPYVNAFIGSINRGHTRDWVGWTKAYEHPLPRTADAALRLMWRGWRDGERIGRALLGPLPRRSRRR